MEDAPYLLVKGGLLSIAPFLCTTLRPRTISSQTWIDMHQVTEIGTVFSSEHTVDGQNPAPPRMITIPLFIGFKPSQVVQDFFNGTTIFSWIPTSPRISPRISVEFPRFPEPLGIVIWASRPTPVHLVGRYLEIHRRAQSLIKKLYVLLYVII